MDRYISISMWLHTHTHKKNENSKSIFLFQKKMVTKKNEQMKKNPTNIQTNAIF